MTTAKTKQIRVNEQVLPLIQKALEVEQNRVGYSIRAPEFITQLIIRGLEIDVIVEKDEPKQPAINLEAHKYIEPTEKEKKVICMFIKNYSAVEIGREIGVHKRSVTNYAKKAMEKMEATTKTEAYKRMLEAGFIEN